MSASITWITQAGLLGVYPANVAMEYKLQAIITDGTLVNYKIISGALPAGINFRGDGKIYGTPESVDDTFTGTFVVRITATDGITESIKDRTFSLQITGLSVPSFITTTLPNSNDSIWYEELVEVYNPIVDNPVVIRVFEGELPPGLEINEYGLIRGYPLPPFVSVNLPAINTLATATDGLNNAVTLLSTDGFDINRPIQFSGVVFGNIISGKVYYVKEILNSTQVTISNVIDGSAVPLSSATGFMDASLLATVAGQPTKIIYTFTLELVSPRGSDKATYSIEITNQNLSAPEGPGEPPNTRKPTILNTQPATYNIAADTVNYGYYVLPPNDTVTTPGTTYLPSQDAYIGQFLSGNYFSFHILGYDFDGDELKYTFNGEMFEPGGWATGNSSTGWIIGNPNVPINDIEEFTFQVQVSKVTNFGISSSTYNFTFRIVNNIDGDVVWVTPSNLGIFDNSTVCLQNIKATSDIPLKYEITSGELPPNLNLTSDGEIQGIISYQPSDNYEEFDQTKEFTFTVKASALDDNLENIIYSSKTFTMTVKQLFTNPTDNLYIKCTPGAQSRNIISSLLDDNYLIPENYLYRPTDNNFGKAKNVTYAHAYGIYSSNLEEYITAVQKNHYWRNITLGSLSTAVARDESGTIIYEVVYSNIIDNLMKYDPNQNVDYRYAVSISEEIYWPRFIDLNLGPWYTSSSEIYTSYIFAQDAYIITNYREYDLLTQSGVPLLLNQGVPLFNTNLSPGYARILYPNSLDNMRKRVEQELGANDDFRKLPLWMTCQQDDGNTLGFTPAWVICYVKPAEDVVVTASQTLGTEDAVVLSSVENMNVGGEIIFTGSTFGNILGNVKYYIKQIGVPGYPTGVVLSTTKGGATVSLYSETGTMTGTFTSGSYAEIIKDRIENDWSYTLNDIDFKIDRFTVDKQITYDFDTYVDLDVWTEYPSAMPEPDPTDSQNFYVLFPQKTILPTKTQYNL